RSQNSVMNSIHRGRGWPRVWGNSGREGVCGGTAALGSTTSALMDFLAKERTGLHGDGHRNRARITDRPRVVNRQARQTRWTAPGYPFKISALRLKPAP